MQLTIDDAVVDQYIGVHCTVVEGFHLNVDGGLGVVLRRFIEGDIVSACDGDALRHIVRGLADVYSAAAGDVEKRHSLAGGLLLQYVRHAVHLLIKQRLGLVLLVQQRRVQLDPLHPTQGLGLVAGCLHQHGDAQPLQLLQYRRRVIDHGVFHRQITALRQDQLIIRLGVLAGVYQRSAVHGVLGTLDIPVRLLFTAEGDTVDGVQLVEVVHGSGGYQIDLVQRLVQNSDAGGCSVRHRRALRYQQVHPVVVDGDALVALSGILYGKLLGIAQGHGTVKDQLIPRYGGSLSICFGRGVCRAAGTEGQHQQQQRQYRGGQPFHWAASTAVVESKVRVYSISWGVLMAVVSPITVSGVSSARTGISKVEPPSVVRTS